MKFSTKERLAIGKASLKMLRQDGHADVQEAQFTIGYWERLGIDPSMFGCGDSITEEEALQVIAQMSEQGKRFTQAFLGTLITIDGKVDEEEMRLWEEITQRCALPKMTLEECQHELKECSLMNFI